MTTKRNTIEPLPALPARHAQGTPLSLLIAVMVLTIGPMIALSQVIAYWRTDVVDDQMFGYFGWRIAHGATVYLDVWDNKPPGIYWVNALGMLVGRDSYFGVIGMCVAALVAAHAAFFIIGSSVFHRGAAALATILLSFYLTHPYYTGGTNRTETFLVACELAGVAFYMRGFARDRWWKWYAAGLCCGLAFLFKQVGLAAWGCMGLHLIALVVTRALPLRDGLKRIVLLVVGVGTTVGLAAGVLASQGALGEAIFAAFTFNRSYFTAGASEFPYNFATWTLLKDHVMPILLLPLLMAAAGVIHAFLWWLRPQYRPPEIEVPLAANKPVCPLHVPFFAAWFLVALYGAMVSPHGFRHYLVPCIPPLMLLGGYLINVLRAETKLLRRLQQRAWVTAAFVVMAYFAYESVQLQFREMAKVWDARIDPWMKDHGWYPPDTKGVGKYDPSHWEVVGDAVARITGPADRIQCWGYMPGVYLQARRINACRFITTEKPGQVGAPANFILRELEQTLRAHPPAVLTIQAEDYLWLHGKSLHGLPNEVQLGAWIDENYRLVEEIPKFGTVYICKRKDLVDPNTPRLPECTTQPGAAPTTEP